MPVNEINLNNCKWQLKGFWPYIPLLGKSVETGIEMMGVTDWIDATVPGGAHYDLLKAGIIEDPYFEMNSIKCEWVENRWWVYKTAFTVSEEFLGKKLTLVFKGIDYKAHIYLNDERLGEHKGMFEPACFDISDKIRYGAENFIEVVFESVPDEMSQIGYTSRTNTQKSRFAYKWDWCTRLVNIGFWDDLVIRVTGDFVIDETHITTDIVESTGIVNVSSIVVGKSGEGFTARLALFDGEILLETIDEIFYEDDSVTFAFKKCFKVKNPKLWYTNGSGQQHLYKIVFQIFQKDALSDEKEILIGIRKLEYRQNEDSPEDSLPYTIVMNGEPVYIKGVNLTPFDQMYGTVTRETYEKYVMLLKFANVNMVRVNGVGVIEKEYFYHLCDINGIMIWQDFIQSSSGIENLPSENPEFLKLLEKTVIHAVKTKRNHVSHVIWCGGNELTDLNRIPITYEHLNIKLIQNLVDTYDPGKLLLPSTSSGPIFGLDINQPGKNHDVHGSWKYEGIEKHYKLYNNSDCLFHSEFGVDGMSGMSSLKRFLSDQNIRLTNMNENLVWRHHGEWWDTLSRDEEIFGKFESLEDFIKASQFLQAEGLRYVIEANRRRKFKNSGSIVWQYNEPWPNVSGTYLVDYYGKAKMAYYWVKNAYAPIVASLKHNGLFQMPNSDFVCELFLNNSGNSSGFTVLWELLDVEGKVILKEKLDVHCDKNSVSKIKDINFKIPYCKDLIFFLRIKTYLTEGTEVCQNLYVFSQKEPEIFSFLRSVDRNALKVEKYDEGYRIRNISNRVCLFIHGTGKNEAICTFIENNYISLFPGEDALFKVEIIDENNSSDNSEVDILWDYL